MDSPRKKSKANGPHENQRSIEGTFITNDTSSVSVDGKRTMTAGDEFNLRSGSGNALVGSPASLATADGYPSELRKKRKRSVEGTRQGRSRLTASKTTGGFENAQESVGHGTEAFPAGSSTSNESKQEIGFLTLPGEIRNQIMDLALVPGHIYISNEMQAVDRERSPVSVPGCQILATCRQLYQEGHISFYSRNMFHLAPGPLSASLDYFGRLDRRDQDLIDKVSIEISIMDLVPSVLEGIEATFYEKRGYSIANAINTQVIWYLEGVLEELWVEKIAWVCESKKFAMIRLVGTQFLPEPFGPVHWRALHLEGTGVHRLLPLVRLGKDGQEGGNFLDANDVDERVLRGFFIGALASARNTLFIMLLSEGPEGHSDTAGHWDTMKRRLSELKIRPEYMETVRIREQYFWSEKSGWANHPDSEQQLNLTLRI
ncbi:MAG: hypothetical protein HETSPECPRED_000742 [Heterodermia speciosa]|uniref:Uncharacterized protein n=1 Tax=Heterodermia speciosa TaxID=116794 RepID=A0A8H3IRV9_9LECA|nr:MAG: hypothetical protein HETSPECPRED_000742 [Heterodermia speciosa]